jgi:hypothetical protein
MTAAETTTDAPTLDTSRRRTRAYAPHEQTTAHVGWERLAYVDAEAAIAGMTRCGWLLHHWPRGAGKTLALVQPRHPRASLPMPVRAAALAKRSQSENEHDYGIMTLSGDTWRDDAPALLEQLRPAGTKLSAVVRAVIDGIAETRK